MERSPAYSPQADVGFNTTSTIIHLWAWALPLSRFRGFIVECGFIGECGFIVECGMAEC